MKVLKLGISPEEQAQIEYSEMLSAKQESVQRYNIMMGNLEDPGEGDEEDE